ncbi:uncharacterized protein LOC113291472 [Papaver somniferum]|uniref:uncharacterized protein LOC113291472 n=1 Tax=Papaver somniferum TaxID=3469 RepID=UPI000E6F9DA6|nr:uncharacterized protein LOC113291472 [Papaver somniferum]
MELRWLLVVNDWLISPMDGEVLWKWEFWSDCCGGIVETHVHDLNKDVIRFSINKNRKFIDNYFITSRNLKFAVTMVYGENDSTLRTSFWNDLNVFASMYEGPWVVLGYFNEILSSNERMGSSNVHVSSMNDFIQCIQDTHLFDLHFSGDFFTWSNKKIGSGRIVSKIDIILVNIEWVSLFNCSKADSLNPRVSDHSPMVCSVFEQRQHGPPPFRFFNYLTDEPDFLDIVRAAWNINIKGNPMFVLVSKLKRVKQALRERRRTRSNNLSDLMCQAKEVMVTSQATVQSRPFDANDAHEEKRAVSAYAKLVSFTDNDASFVQFSNLVGVDEANDLISPISRDEIVYALSCIGSSKAPGPDGFSSHFFKVCWSIIEFDFVKAIHNFFSKLKLLGEVNSTFLTLIPKIDNPAKVSDYRPISCCNVIYKCITKIIAIIDNIMLAHEIVRNYHRSNGAPRCSLKNDLRKAYDTVSWEAIFLCLRRMGFPNQFIDRIYICISYVKFAILINGSPYGYFSSFRGLRQGCPLSPYLSVIIM